jgi:hypothetical protein
MATIDSTAPPRAGRSVAYATYDEAQRAVDRLSDEGFPVADVDVIGSDLHLVEHVTEAQAEGARTLIGQAR